MALDGGKNSTLRVLYDSWMKAARWGFARKSYRLSGAVASRGR
jgi:hypothetical protein